MSFSDITDGKKPRTTTRQVDDLYTKLGAVATELDEGGAGEVTAPLVLLQGDIPFDDAIFSIGESEGTVFSIYNRSGGDTEPPVVSYGDVQINGDLTVNGTGTYNTASVHGQFLFLDSGNPNGRLVSDGSGGVRVQNALDSPSNLTAGSLFLTNLPTSDPASPGVVYIDSNGYLKISV
jgi:hypothetical protein